MKKINTVIQTLNHIQSDTHLLKIINELSKTDINGVRINLSKYSTNESIAVAQMITETFENQNIKTNLFFDIPFPKNKTRIISINVADNFLKTGHSYKILAKDCNDKFENSIQMNINSFDLKKGDLLHYADGEGSFIIKEISSSWVTVETINDFKIHVGKAILCGFSPIDYNYVQKLRNNLDQYNLKNIGFILSFVESDEEIKYFKNLFQNSIVISKVETKDAITNINKIVQQSDGVLIARGDLSMNIDLNILDKSISEVCNAAKNNNKKIYYCTDILLHMGNRILPERAELFDLILCNKYGCDSVILPGNIYFQEQYIDNEGKRQYLNIINKIRLIHTLAFNK